MSHAHPPTELDRLLVSTKFAPPRIGAHYIVRTQLLEALRRDRTAKLTFVTGSAGFGKTVLIAQWRQELMKAGAKVAWLSLSADERGLGNFSTHLFSALARLDIESSEQILTTREPGDQIDGAIAEIVNALAIADDDLYLFLDDYHHVDDPWAHRLLQRLIDNTPGNLHLIIASRTIPPLSIAKLRVMGEVSEVECNDLPFALAETRAFLEQNMGAAKLTPEESFRLHELTNGWPASLQLIAIMLKSHPESRTTLHRLGWQSADLQNYLVEEVLDHLPPGLSRFIEALSICPRFNVSLAQAVTQSDDAADLFLQMETANLLVTRVEHSERSPWYRFHPLFADFLQARLARRDPAEVDALHIRAAAWFDERRLLIEAVRHATLGHDITRAVAIIEKSVPTNWRLSYIGPLLHLVEELPLSSLAGHPRLAYLGSLTFALAGAPHRAEQWAQQMKDGPDPATNHFRRSLAQAAIAFQQDDTERTLALTSTMVPGPDTSPFERHAFLAHHVVALAAAGRYAEAEEQFRLYPIAPEEQNDGMALLALGCYTVSLTMQGRARDLLPHVTSIYERHTQRRGRYWIGAQIGAAGLAEALFEADRIDEARETLANRRYSLRRSAPHIIISAALTEARLNVLQNSLDEALAVIRAHADDFFAAGLDRGFAYMLLAQLRIQIGLGNMAAARDAEIKLNELGERHRTSSGFSAEIPMIAAIGRARLAMKRGDHDVVVDAATEARSIATGLGRGRFQVSTDLVIALAHRKRDDVSAAFASLRTALARGDELGLIRTLVDEGAELLDLLNDFLAQAGDEDSLAAYTKTILSHFVLPSPVLAGEEAGNGGRSVLTPREIEILGLVGAGMSNKRIALTTGITLETVKWNLKNIFLKLGVASRYDAMSRAKRDGLIG